MDKRVIVGAIVALLLAGLLVTALVLQGDNTETANLAYPVDWSNDQGPERTKSGQLQENDSKLHQFPVSARNVTQIVVALTWTDDGGDPDKFVLTVDPPNAEPRTAESKNETIRMVFERASAPTVEAFEAANRSSALDAMKDRQTQAGQGNWSVNVTLFSAPGQRPIDDAPELETEPDGSNSYELAFTYRAFRGQLGEPQAPGAR